MATGDSPLPGIFEDYMFVEIFLSRPIHSTPGDDDGWLIGAIPKKALDKNLSVVGLLAYTTNKNNHLIVLPHAFRLTISPDVVRDEKGRPRLQGGQPIPTSKIMLKYIRDVAISLHAIAFMHELIPSSAADRSSQDWSMVAINIIRESMSKIERASIVPPK